MRLLESWQNPVYAFARRALGHEADAADVTQEVLLALVRHHASLSDGSKEKAWVYRITRNAVAKHIRGSRRAADRLARVAHPDPAPSSAEVAEGRELESSVVAQLRSLPEELRAVVELRFMAGLTQVEVAEALGVPRGTIRSRIDRALDLLKARLSAAGCAAVVPDLSLAFASPPTIPAELAASIRSLAANTGAANPSAALGKVGLPMTLKVLIAVSLSAVGGGFLIANALLEAPSDQTADKTAATAPRGLSRPAAQDRPASGEAAPGESAPGPAAALGASAAPSRAAAAEAPASAADRAPRIRGRLVDHEGGAIADAEADARRGRRRAGQAGLNPINVASDKNKRADITLRGAGRVTGMVLDPDGAPAPGAKVMFQLEQGLKWSSRGRTVRSGRGPLVATADASGAYAIDRVPAGRHTISAWSEGFRASLEEELELAPGAAVERGLRLRVGHRARIVVKDAAGMPIPGVAVRLGKRRQAAIRTDSEGAAVFEGISEPDLILRVEDEGYSSIFRAITLPIEDDRSETELTLYRGVTIFGRVTSPRRVDAGLIQLSKLPAPVEKRHSAGVQAMVKADGSFEFNRMNPGRYELRTMVDGHVDTRREISIAPGQDRADLGELALTPFAKVAVTVRDSLDRPAAGLLVLCGDPRVLGTSDTTRLTDSEGAVTLDQMPPGRRLLVVSRGQKVLAFHECTIDGAAGSVDITLPERLAGLAGAIELREGQSPFVNVGLMRRGEKHIIYAEVGKGQSFDFGELPSGSYQVVGFHRGSPFRPVPLGAVELAEGEKQERSFTLDKR